MSRKIPKTIVEAEDTVPTKVATLGDAKIRPDATGEGVGSRRRRTGTNARDTADLRDSAREARPTAAGDRSLIRALGLKIGKIVIDAGHGGHDTGTIGPNGLLEKDVVLDVAKRLGRLLQSRLGAEVIYTRQDDTFIPLKPARSLRTARGRTFLFPSTPTQVMTPMPGGWRPTI